jgi:hypothetical protein
MENIYKIFVINVAEYLFPILLTKLLEKEKGEHIERECYVYIMFWILQNIEKKQYHLQIMSIDESANDIGNLFSGTLNNIVNDFFEIKIYYKSILSSINASIYAHNFFKTHKNACHAHILDSKLEILNFLDFKHKCHHRGGCSSVEEAYPEHNRPRGNKDLESVEYHRNLIKFNQDIQPIWVINKGYDGKSFTILDGHHRMVAYSLEKKYNIPAYVIYI